MADKLSDGARTLYRFIRYGLGGWRHESTLTQEQRETTIKILQVKGLVVVDKTNNLYRTTEVGVKKWTAK